MNCTRYLLDSCSLIAIVIDLSRHLIVAELDAGGRVEIAALERVENRPRREPFRPNVDPTPPRPGHVRVSRILERVRVIVGDAVQHLPFESIAIPDFFHARHAAAAEIVHEVMTVEDFEQTQPFDLLQVAAGDRPDDSSDG